MPGGNHALTGVWPGTHVQLESARHHDYGPWGVAIFVHGKFDRLSTIDKKTTTESFWILDDPVAVAVFADQKKWET
jgi:hypothetical protein